MLLLMYVCDLHARQPVFPQQSTGSLLLVLGKIDKRRLKSRNLAG